MAGRWYNWCSSCAENGQASGGFMMVQLCWMDGDPLQLVFRRVVRWNLWDGGWLLEWQTRGLGWDGSNVATTMIRFVMASGTFFLFLFLEIFVHRGSGLDGDSGLASYVLDERSRQLCARWKLIGWVILEAWVKFSFLFKLKVQNVVSRVGHLCREQQQDSQQRYRLPRFMLCYYSCNKNWREIKCTEYIKL